MLLFLVLLIGMCILIHGLRKPKSNDLKVQFHREDWILAGILTTGIPLIICIVIYCSFSSCVITAECMLDKHEQELLVLEQYYEDVEKTIQANLADFPLEQKLFATLSPSLFLKLPEIQSHTLILENIEQLLHIKSEMIKVIFRVNTLIYNIRCAKAWSWILPTYIPYTAPEGEYEDRLLTFRAQYGSMLE